MSDAAVNNTINVARKILAYFGPVNRDTGAPSVFDPAREASFNFDAPPSPWIAIGEVREFRRTSATKYGVLAAGAKGAAAGQFRAGLEAKVAFDFCEWGKLQMALAGGSQHMNVLAADPSSSAEGSGGAALSPVAVLDGSSATELILGVGAVDAFAVGDVVAVDVDYAEEVGYVGSGIRAAYVKDAADVRHDRDYVRRVTFNVARVADKTTTSLLLSQPLLGGAPASGATLQKVVGFVDREGGSYFQEWSGLFVVEAESGARTCFYYPRLQATLAASETALKLDAFQMQALHAEFTALPVKDDNDGESVVCFRSYFPASGAAIY